MAPAKILLFGVCWLTAFTLSGCGKQGTTPESPLSAGADNESQRASQPLMSAVDKDVPSNPPTQEVGSGSSERNSGRLFDPDTASIAELREVTLRALEAGEDDLAFSMIRKAIAREPENAELIYLHAMILAERNRFREAIVILDELSSKLPQSRIAFLGQTARWSGEAGSYEDAERRFEEILSVIPDDVQVHHFFGQLLLQLGRRHEANQHFRFLAAVGGINQDELRAMLLVRNAFAGDEENSRLMPLDNLARARQSLGNGEPDQARVLLEEANTVSSKSLKGRLLTLEGKWKDAEELIGSLREGNLNPDWCYARACLEEQNDRPKEALQYVVKAILLDPTDAESYDKLSVLCKSVNLHDVSEEAKQRAITLRRTVELGQGLVGEDPGNREPLAELIDLLKELQRPLEVFAWRSIDLVYAVQEGAISDSEAQQRFEAIGQERQLLLNNGIPQPSRAFLLCGYEG